MAKPLVLWQSHHHLIMPPRDYLKFQIRKDISSALFLKILKKKTPSFFKQKLFTKIKPFLKSGWFTLFEIFIFCPKIQLCDPEKMSIFFLGVKNS